MRLFDTRRGALAPLHPAHTVRVYVCGITPYDSTHLGHAFTYASFDALMRVLEARGHRVRYVRNVTDVDDDMLRRAAQVGEPFDELARREIARFDRDLESLNLRPPDAVPWATKTVPAMVAAVGVLVDRGLAYALPDGRVYFDTAAAGDAFGAFSRLDPAEMLQQFREKGGDPDAPGKRAQLDFLLWQPQAPGEPAWPSRWGAGRPGWHIECSVMAMEELGPVIDIHGGGKDLVYPHHEAEVLQSEGVTGQGPFARFWLHTGMVALSGEKMSKSLGNLVFVGDLLERYEGAAVRHYLLRHHYRSDWHHDDELLADSARRVKAWWETPVEGASEELEAAAHAALDDDLDVPRALERIDAAAAAGAGATVRRLADLLGFTPPC